jgi:hypothetical protein
LLLTNAPCGDEIAAKQKRRISAAVAAQGSETIVKTLEWPIASEDVRHYRALGSICRQQAVLHPEASWTWLSQAEKWEDLAEAAAAEVAAPALSGSRYDDAGLSTQKAA